MTMTIAAQKNTSGLSPALADLDARMNAKESFADRIGLLPFAAGALTVLVILSIAKLMSGL